MEGYRRSKGLSQQEMADLLGISQQVYSNIESEKKKKLDSDFVVKYKEITGINLWDLQDNVVNQTTESTSYIEKRRTHKNSDNPFLVPFVDVPAQAGYTKAYQQIDYINTLKKYPILPDVDPTGAVWRYFQISGDSMEPEFRNGDTILCSQVPRDDWNQFTDFYTYVVVTDDNLWIKDVYKESEDKWLLLSQNENHQAFYVNVADVRQLWVMRRHIKARAKKHRLYDLNEIRKSITN